MVSELRTNAAAAPAAAASIRTLCPTPSFVKRDGGGNRELPPFVVAATAVVDVAAVRDQH